MGKSDAEDHLANPADLLFTLQHDYELDNTNR